MSYQSIYESNHDGRDAHGLFLEREFAPIDGLEASDHAPVVAELAGLEGVSE